MTRRDLIIVAVLANIGVLAILFMLAFRSDEEQGKENTQVAYTMTEETVNVNPEPTPVEVPVKQPEPIDMIDAALDEEGLTPAPSVITADDDNFQLIEPETAAKDSKAPEVASQPEQVAPVETAEPKYVDVTIKRGDALEKIARANGTTVAAIIKANDLKNDRLKIGQTLKVPVGSKKVASTPTANKQIAQADTKASQADTKASPEYYTVKSGDNPWKIAKQFNMKVDDFLKLNNLNEEKARNLKVGDKVRVK